MAEVDPTDDTNRIVRLEERTEAYTVYTVLGGPGTAPDERALDYTDAPVFVAQLQQEIKTGVGALILDLQPLVFIDSAGLAALVHIRQSILPRPLFAVGLQPGVKRSFAILRLDRFVRIVNNVSAAVAAIAPPPQG